MQKKNKMVNPSAILRITIRKLTPCNPQRICL